MDRISFFNSISGIDYPNMLVKFYDHFLALKELMQVPSFITVTSRTNDDYISFLVKYNEKKDKDRAIHLMYIDRISIYGRMISISIEALTDTELMIILR